MPGSVLLRRPLARSLPLHPATPRRWLATAVAAAARPHHHRVVVVGGGTAGVTVAAQLMRTRQFESGDIAILDPAREHHYQPGWTLVGTGLKPLSQMRRPLASIIPPGVTHHALQTVAFDPASNLVRTAEGVDFSYDYLIVAPGLEVNFAAVKGLPEALRDRCSLVSSIYGHDTVEQVWSNIQSFRRGAALFTQPAGAIKCAGAPQKVLWMALSQWKRDGARDQIQPTFATGGASMFAVPKYSQALEGLRKARGVEGLFQHDLVAVDAERRVATFKNLADGGREVTREYGFLHAVPPQRPWGWVAKSPLADGAGWVDVDKATTRHVRFPNVFSIGDASSLPTSKTAAAVTAQAPVLVDNLLATIRGAEPRASYSGYASCPLLTGHGELILCEFKYGGVPAETFGRVLGSQDRPSRLLYHLKKDFFPAVYWSAFVKGLWYGPRTFWRPKTAGGV